jgi:hypothetical protein
MIEHFNKECIILQKFNVSAIEWAEQQQAKWRKLKELKQMTLLDFASLIDVTERILALNDWQQKNSHLLLQSSAGLKKEKKVNKLSSPDFKLCSEFEADIREQMKAAIAQRPNCDWKSFFAQRKKTS